MEIIIPRKLVYVLDRAVLEHKMAVNNLSFMLEQHTNDSTDDFLTSELFQRLHTELVIATVKKWCSEIAVLKNVVGNIPNKYYIDIENAKALVEV